MYFCFDKMNDKVLRSAKNKIPVQHKPYVCEICFRKFSSKIHFQVHSITHLVEENFDCDSCKEGINQIFDLDNHFETHDDYAEAQICNICEKKFVDKESLDKHIRSHCDKNSFTWDTNRETSNHGLSLNMCFEKGTLSACDELNDKSVEDKHVQTCNLIFFCDVCNAGFYEKNDLDEHQKLHTRRKRGRAKKLPSNDNVHILTVEKSVHIKQEEVSDTTNVEEPVQPGKWKRVFACDECPKRYANKHTLKVHRFMHSTEKPFTCKFCDKKFSLKSLWKSHEYSHKEKKYFCGVCQKGFVSKHGLFIHVHSHAMVKSYTCDVCQLTFSEKESMESHRQSHGQKPFECEICHKSFALQKILRAHKLIHTGEKPHECDICKKRFTKAGNLQRHQLIHSGIKPFKCDVCQASFSRKSILDYHSRVHQVSGESDSKSKVCKLCPEGFMIKSSGNSHLCIHREVKPFECDQCGKRFSTKRYQQKHAVIHSENKPFVCDICKKSFFHKNNLQSHLKTHTGEKPYLCDVCGKTFAEKARLQIHAVRHKDKKPFTCEVCYRGFPLKSFLDRHYVIHTGERPYICDKCGKGFTQKTQMQKHYTSCDGDIKSETE